MLSFFYDEGRESDDNSYVRLFMAGPQTKTPQAKNLRVEVSGETPHGPRDSTPYIEESARVEPSEIQISYFVDWPSPVRRTTSDRRGTCRFRST